MTPSSGSLKPICFEHLFCANHPEACLGVRSTEQKARPQRHAGVVGQFRGVMTCCECRLINESSHRTVAGATQPLRKAKSIPLWPLADKCTTDCRDLEVRRRSTMGANSPAKTAFDACCSVSLRLRRDSTTQTRDRTLRIFLFDSSRMFCYRWARPLDVRLYGGLPRQVQSTFPRFPHFRRHFPGQSQGNSHHSHSSII